MQRVGAMMFLLALALAAGFIVATTPELPERLATHFGPDGRPDAWMARDRYLVLGLALAVGMPALATGLIAFMARRAPRLVNMPNRDYWMAPERRTATAEWLTAAALWLGALLALLMAAMHAMVIAANRMVPPHLFMTRFVAVMALFLLAMVTWTVLFHRRFRRRRDG